ncbi:hypothetical protein ABT158_19730 [Nonomuraea sp. NPDC001636]|uniref:DUF7336 domain-containing protein n=1 Tax=Nonomuraea sp. NPDC001636 TaxID=3154391 RepID=UPI003316ECCD
MPASRVYMLWHVHHVAQDENGNVVHFPGADFSAQEDRGDDVKLLGVYSSEERARRRIASARALPGFRDEPDCFWYGEVELDADAWPEGFVSGC